MNEVCGRDFWLKSSNTELPQWHVIIPSPAAKREGERIFLCDSLFFGAAGSMLSTHTLPEILIIWVCKNVSSEKAQTYFKRLQKAVMVLL